MNDDLDVVTRLEDHQQNLSRPEGMDVSIGIVALPTPPLCATMPAPLQQLVRATRQQDLALAAAVYGAGDSVYALDLDAERIPLTEALRRIQASRVSELVLYGARDQPGFARFFMVRFAGRVHIPAPDRDSALRVVLDRQGAWSCGEAGQDVVVEVLEDGVPPVPCDPRRWFCAADRDRVLAPWCGFLPPLAVRSCGADQRRGWLAYWAASGHGQQARNAAVGVDPHLDACSTSTDAAGAPRQQPLEITITGLDGSGKTTQTNLLVEQLRARGWRASALKLYRRGAFLELATELGARTRTGFPLAAFRIARQIKLVDSLLVYRDAQPLFETSDVIVHDRHIETHVAAARAQLEWDLERSPILTVFSPVARAFLLDIDPGQALERIAERSSERSADEHEVGLRGYAREFARAADAAPERYIRLDSNDSRDRINAAILDEVLRLTPRPGQRPAARIVASPTQPSDDRKESDSSPRASAPSALVIGGNAEGNLARDAIEAAQFARSRLPRSAEIPTSFWLEAYATSILVELRKGAHSGPLNVALWPFVFRRLAGFRDLYVLDDLEKVVLRSVAVSGYRVDEVSVACQLENLLGRAPRFIVTGYVDALRAHAADLGWVHLDQ